MGKVANFFKAIPSAYYDWRKRNEKIDALLDNYNSTLDLLTKLQRMRCRWVRAFMPLRAS